MSKNQKIFKICSENFISFSKSENEIATEFQNRKEMGVKNNLLNRKTRYYFETIDVRGEDFSKIKYKYKRELNEKTGKHEITYNTTNQFLK